MATSDDFVNSALRKIGVKGAETTVTATELSDGMEVLNDMADQLDAEGFELGFTTLTTGSDTVTIPSYANLFFKLNLGAQLLNEYQGSELSPSFSSTIEGARRAVVRELNRKSVGETGTYQDLIYGAFELSGVKSGSEPINAIELANALPRLNDLLTELEGKGFYLGYNVNTGTVLTELHGLPDWSNSWLKAELAIRLSSSYSIQPNEVIIKMSVVGLEDAYNRYTDAPTVQMPDTLPLGDGRHYLNNRYVNNTATRQIQTGQGGILADDEGQPILIEDNTDD